MEDSEWRIEIVWRRYDPTCRRERFPFPFPSSLFPVPFSLSPSSLLSSVDSLVRDVESGERGLAGQHSLFGMVGEVIGTTKDGQIRLFAGFE